MSDSIDNNAPKALRRFEVLMNRDCAVRVIIEASSAEEAEELIDAGEWHDEDIVSSEALDTVVCEVNELPQVDAPETAASAKSYTLNLWLAGPELLEALQELLPHAMQEVDDRKSTGIACYADLEAAVEKATAALAQATGGAA